MNNGDREILDERNKFMVRDHSTVASCSYTSQWTAPPCRADRQATTLLFASSLSQEMAFKNEAYQRMRHLLPLQRMPLPLHGQFKWSITVHILLFCSCLLLKALACCCWKYVLLILDSVTTDYIFNCFIDHTADYIMCSQKDS